MTRTIVMRDAEAATRELEAKVVASAADDAQDHAADAPQPCGSIRSIVRDVKNRTELEMIKRALEAFGWNRRRAAQHLDISYRALLYKIQQHRLRPWAGGAPEEPFEHPLLAAQRPLRLSGLWCQTTIRQSVICVQCNGPNSNSQEGVRE